MLVALVVLAIVVASLGGFAVGWMCRGDHERDRRGGYLAR